MRTAVATWGRLERRPHLVDVWIGAVLTVLAQVQVPADTPIWVRVSLAVATVAVVWRRDHPLAATAVVAAGVGAMAFTTDPPSVFGEYLAVLLMSFTVADRLPLASALLGAALLVIGAVAHDRNSSEFAGAAGVASDLAIPAVLFGLGRVVRWQRLRAEGADERAAQVERDSRQRARLAVAEERAHLARELHDVVTHSLSMVVVQAQGAQRILGEGHDDVRGALVTIEEGSRGALTDMRRLLGLLRTDDEAPALAPSPELTELNGLLERVRAAGLPVELAVRGDLSAVSAGVGLCAYRIVQEALTNSLKHSNGAFTRVQVVRDTNGLDVLVEDDGPGTAPPTAPGRGLLGMRERMALYGGQLDAGPGSDGGFRVHARFPPEALT